MAGSVVDVFEVVEVDDGKAVVVALFSARNRGAECEFKSGTVAEFGEVVRFYGSFGLSYFGAE